MSLAVNHNAMAANVARNLNAHYAHLGSSTRRLSTGLRINAAADDAAGLAISELQRADIAALRQGVRNANDAISLIQTADGAMGVIDEKLIRMRELAEQGATGTYTSTQRLMIESEYQQMASEITRIANATDFNGIKLLDGTLSGVHDGSRMTATGALKVHFGSGNDSAEDYYYIEIGDVTAQALGLGNSSTYAEDRERLFAQFRDNLEKNMLGWNRGAAWQQKAHELIDGLVEQFAFKVNKIQEVLESANGRVYVDFNDRGGDWGTGGASVTFRETQLAEAWNRLSDAEKQFYGRGLPKNMPPETVDDYAALSDSDREKVLYAYTRALVHSWSDDDATIASFGDRMTPTDWNNRIGRGWSLTILNRDVTDIIESAPGYGALGAHVQRLQGFWGRVYNEYALTGWATPDAPTAQEQADARNAADTAVALANDALHSMAVALETRYDAAGRSITTQEDAQLALNAITNAIVEKDKIRAHIGALQNRLENTITNLNVQAENLQAAESRIRDVDVATEMTEFTRQQVLTQSAVAMLSQANSLPQMAMQLIGG